MTSAENLRTYKVVVTGFGPFQGVSINESWLAVSGLWEENLPTQVKLVTRELPVVYSVVKNEVLKLWETENPDLIIHVGVSKADTQISVEKQSFNLEYCHLDITNSCPENECCVTEGPEILETGLDVDRLCNASNGKLRNFNYKAYCAKSDDPGRYLCGFTYYLSLHRDRKKSLFVHVPDMELFPVKDMTIALRSIIIDAINQLYDANLVH